jgi:murein DD-endopeptidase MepM/ murein hydrolase activator NlpD
MSQMPLLGRPPRRPRRRLVLAVALLAVAAAAVWFFAFRKRAPSPPAEAPVAAAPVAPPPDAAPPPPPAPVDELARAGVRYVRATVEGPLETAIVKQVGRALGEPLTGVVTRTLVWWVSVPADLRRGDVVEVLATERVGAEPLVHAVRFSSQKDVQTYETFRWQPPGAAFARFYTRDGKELELRLHDAPLDDYEQVTSLLRDGRGHAGVDFKVPVGTPVKATFDSVVVRKNWNFRGNGNCVELRENAGSRRSAYFLHLSEVPEDLRAGDKVTRGQIVARSGNSGRSFAPHLHYQLVSTGGKILDPFESHGTVRRALPDDQKAAFDTEVARLESLLARGAEAFAATASRPDAGPAASP